MDSRDEEFLMGSGMGGDLDREINEALGDMSLMDLVDAGDQPGGGAAAAADGVRRGTVVAIQKDDVLVDLGSKSTGVLPRNQLGEGAAPQVGDTIEVTVTGFSESEGLLLLSQKDAVTAAAWDTLAVGQTVEGVVTGHNKGGLELKIDGIKSFMPISQIDVARIEEDDLKGFTQRRMSCRVMEFRRGEKKLVVSRRAVLEAEAAVKAEATFETLEEGQIVTGTVRTIMPYGAFVDIGGVDGLLHVKDMGFGRVEDPSAVVSIGQQLSLMVLRVDRDERKIALGLKQTLDDPWKGAEHKWPVGIRTIFLPTGFCHPPPEGWSRPNRIRHIDWCTFLFWHL